MAATAPVIGVLGRGRGRGRGLRANALRQPGGNIQKKSDLPETKIIQQSDQIVCTSEESHSADVTDIMKKLNGLTESEVMKDVLPQIEALKSQQVIEDLVNALCEKALLDAPFAMIAAKLAHKIWENESMHGLVRNPLLKQTQDYYSKREKLWKDNQYHGLCVYLCELFKYLRFNQRPLLAVGEAAVNLLKGLVEKNESPSNEDVFYFHQEMESIGSITGELFPEKLEEIINLARQMVISSSLVPSVRCRLVQLIELHAAKWKMKDEIKSSYNVLLCDLKSPE